MVETREIVGWIVSIIIALVMSGVATKVWRHFRDRTSIHARRAEVDRIAAKLAQAEAERGRALKERDEEAAKRRRLEESLSATRRIVIEAPCLGQEALPPWPIPTRKEEK